MLNRPIINNFVTIVPTHSCIATSDALFSAIIILASDAPKGGKEG
jgi:hypothetical protein